MGTILESSDELSDLEDLVRSPGWTIFVHYMTGDINHRFLDGIQQIMGEESVGESALHRIRAHAAQREDRMILASWPNERIATLEAAKKRRDAASTRRGRV